MDIKSKQNSCMPQMAFTGPSFLYPVAVRSRALFRTFSLCWRLQERKESYRIFSLRLTLVWLVFISYNIRILFEEHFLVSILGFILGSSGFNSFVTQISEQLK